MNSMGLALPRAAAVPPRRDLLNEWSRRDKARSSLVSELATVTAASHNLADALLELVDLRDPGGKELDLRFMRSGTPLADCICRMSPRAWDALKDYAVASGSPMEKVVFGADFGPSLHMTQQMRRLSLRYTIDFDDVPQRQPARFDMTDAPMPTTEDWLVDNDRVFESSNVFPTSVRMIEATAASLDIAGERSTASHLWPYLPADDTIAAEVSVNEQADPVLTEVQALQHHMYACCLGAPTMPVQRRDHARYHELRYQLRDSDSLRSMTTRTEMSEFFLAPGDASMLDLALRRDPWPAAAIVLGILESGAPLKLKAQYLASHAPEVIARLAKIRDPRERQHSQEVIREIQTAWAPAAHLLEVSRKRTVMLKNAGATHAEACRRAKLTTAGMLEGGTKLVCSAIRPIKDLAKYAAGFDEFRGLHLYAVPTAELAVRRTSLLSWL